MPLWGVHNHYWCGCWYYVNHQKFYLPQVQLKSHTTILATTSRTSLMQTFVNSRDSSVPEIQYTFPLYDGVSVVAFKCTVGDKVIEGIVKEKEQARADFKAAVDRGETAGLLEQSAHASDVFTTKIGNVPARGEVVVEITYLGELKNDAETDGARFTIPTTIAPRYGSDQLASIGPTATNKGGIEICVDVVLEEGASLRGIQSPSHPIAVSVGRTSTMPEDYDGHSMNYGSASLTLGSTELDKDFVIIVLAKGQDTPRALLETHPSFPHQRALMTTLVPKFNLPNIHPELVFVVDRSGSMHGKMHLVIEALKVFLKSLPIGVKFNICSFGSSYSFLFNKSRTYDESSLQEAMQHLSPSSFDANYGGTEMLSPVKAVVNQRWKQLPLEIMILTDGEIYDQQAMFDFLDKQSKNNVRCFSLGVGDGASSSLVEGIARAGKGFSQWVNDGEKIDKRIVRMLKGALMPHITDYSIELKYDGPTEIEDDDDDFTLVESFEKSMKELTIEKPVSPKKKNPISLFNPLSKDEPTNPPAGRYDCIPSIEVPNVIQAPHEIPGLYPHSRITIYLLLGPNSNQAKPKAVILRGTCDQGPLELEIPIQHIGDGETIHQLAAKKAIHELEQGRGWVSRATLKGGQLLKSKYEAHWDLVVEREAVRLGVQFQVGGKYCSFVAVEREASQQEKVVDEKACADSSYPVSDDKARRSVSRKVKLAQGGYLSSKASTAGVMGSAPPPPPPLQAPGGASFFACRNSQAPADRSLFGGLVPQPTGSLFGSAPPAPPAPPAASLPIFSNQQGMAAGGPPRSFGRGGFGTVEKSKERREATNHSMSKKKASPSMSFGGLFGSSAPKSAPPPPAPVTASYIPSAYSSGPGTLSEGASSVDADECEEEEAEAFDLGFADGASGSSAAPMARSAAAPASFLSSSRKRSGSSSNRAKGEAAPMSPVEKMHKLIELQTFTGSWKVGNELFVVLGLKDKSQVSDEVKATIAAIAWLKVHVKGEKDVWELVVEKAENWLQSQGVDDVESIIEKACGYW